MENNKFSREEIPEKIKQVAEELLETRKGDILDAIPIKWDGKKNIKIYLAGGYLHDKLLGIEYKDIDIFASMSDIDADYLDRCETLSRYDDNIELLSSYDEWSLISIRYDDINVIIKKGGHESLKTTVKWFDINSTHVGVELILKKSPTGVEMLVGEIYIGEEFYRYIEEGLLEIVNFQNPIYSIIRVYEKAARYGCLFEERGLQEAALRTMKVENHQIVLPVSSQWLDLKWNEIKQINWLDIEEVGVEYKLYCKNIEIDPYKVPLMEEPAVKMAAETYGLMKTSSFIKVTELMRPYNVGAKYIVLLSYLHQEGVDDESMLLKAWTAMEVNKTLLFKRKVEKNSIESGHPYDLERSLDEFYFRRSLMEGMVTYRSRKEIVSWIRRIFPRYNKTHKNVFCKGEEEIAFEVLSTCIQYHVEELLYIHRNIVNVQEDVSGWLSIASNISKEQLTEEFTRELKKLVRKWESYRLYSPNYSQEELNAIKPSLQEMVSIAFRAQNLGGIDFQDKRWIDKLIINAVFRSQQLLAELRKKSLDVKPGILSKFVYKKGKFTVRSYRSKNDAPVAVFIGKFTNCCQTIGSVGECCAISSVSDEGTDVLVVEDSNQIPLSVSYVWKPNPDTVILDNIEVNQGHRGSEMDQLWLDIIKALPYNNVLVGTGFNDVSALNKSRRESPRYRAPVKYTDAQEVFVVKGKVSPQTIVIEHNPITIEFSMPELKDIVDDDDVPY